jgi:hypothetical protein
MQQFADSRMSPGYVLLVGRRLPSVMTLCSRRCVMYHLAPLCLSHSMHVRVWKVCLRWCQATSGMLCHLQQVPVIMLLLLLLQDDRAVSGDTPEKTFENAVTALKQQIKFSPDEVRQECSILLACRTCTAAAVFACAGCLRSVLCTWLLAAVHQQYSLPLHKQALRTVQLVVLALPCGPSPDQAMLCCAACSCHAS